MSTRVSERRLVDVLISFFRPGHHVAREMRHYERSIDLATMPLDSDELWAIEAKTTNWSIAVGQAITNLSAAERSYVALYSKNIHRVDLELLDQYGIGLISVGTKWGEVEVVKTANKSPYVNRLASDRLRARLSSGVG